MNFRAFNHQAALVLAAANLCGAPAFAGADAKTMGAVTVGTARLERIYHDQLLLPDREHAGFGSLLYDERGELALHDAIKTWLYTTGLAEAAAGGQRDWYGKWISYVREFNVKTLASGKPKIALGLAEADRWAVIHDVMRVSANLFVAFYSANGSVRAASSDRPDGLFKAVPGFKIEVTDAWERQGGKTNSLESNGAHVLIERTERELTEWIGYD